MENYKSTSQVWLKMQENEDKLAVDSLNKYYFDNIIILDHHQETDQTIATANSIINENASSACEIVTNLIEQYNVKLDSEVATVILSGIVLDTNNFIVLSLSLYTVFVLLSAIGLSKL